MYIIDLAVFLHIVEESEIYQNEMIMFSITVTIFLDLFKMINCLFCYLSLNNIDEKVKLIDWEIIFSGLPLSGGYNSAGSHSVDLALFLQVHRRHFCSWYFNTLCPEIVQINFILNFNSSINLYFLKTKAHKLIWIDIWTPK